MLEILAIWEVEIRKIMVRGQPRQKVHENPSQWKKAGVVAQACYPSYCMKHKIGRLQYRLA
jgi:hypothetical protein